MKSVTIVPIALLILCACNDGGSRRRQPMDNTVQEFPSDSHTVALWHFDEGIGQDLLDSSGNGNHIGMGSSPLSDEVSDPAWNADGRFGHCISYTRAENDYCSGGVGNTFPTNECTVELWFRSTYRSGFLFNAGFINCQIAYGGPNPSEIYFAIGDGMNWTFCTILDQGVNDLITDGQWHYLAGTYDGVLMRFYVDGVEQATQPATTTLASPNIYHVGGRPSNTFIDGDIDEVRLSDVARSATEIYDYFHP